MRPMSNHAQPLLGRCRLLCPLRLSFSRPFTRRRLLSLLRWLLSLRRFPGLSFLRTCSFGVRHPLCDDRLEQLLMRSRHQARLIVLKLRAQIGARDLWEEEGGDEVLDHLVLGHVLALEPVDNVVEERRLRVRLHHRLLLGGRLDGLRQDALQIALDRALVDVHDLAVHLVLLRPSTLLLQPLALLLRLPHRALALGEHDHGEDTTLLLEAHQLLREVVQHLANLAPDGTGDVAGDELVLVPLQRLAVAHLAVVLDRLHRA
mmetsp:Transcript_24768/g.58848  ORF Transcript_24768/g.58848 Transcript_24768/m.58848 type:complete len:261 (+) Transcript_24768:53-835(+)